MSDRKLEERDLVETRCVRMLGFTNHLTSPEIPVLLDPGSTARSINKIQISSFQSLQIFYHSGLQANDDCAGISPATSIGNTPADVAELADALDSGSSGGNPVEVQVLSSALFSPPQNVSFHGVFCVCLRLRVQLRQNLPETETNRRRTICG